MRRIQSIPSQKKKFPAVSQTLALDCRRRRGAQRKLIEKVLSGKTDFALTNDELERRDVQETR